MPRLRYATDWLLPRFDTTKPAQIAVYCWGGRLCWTLTSRDLGLLVKSGLLHFYYTNQLTNTTGTWISGAPNFLSRRASTMEGS